jgi:hypothetical protein
MPDILKPRDAKEVEDALRWALDGDKALEVAGRGSKRAMGRPSQTDLTLDLSGRSGIRLYEPAELVRAARAGPTLAESEARRDSQGPMPGARARRQGGGRRHDRRDGVALRCVGRRTFAERRVVARARP